MNINEVKQFQKLAGINESTANVVDSIPEIQRYLKDLAVKLPQVKGIDVNEVKGIVELLNSVINKLGKGSVGPAIKASSDVFNKRTQALK
jgi:hypothetical protein